MNKQKTFLIIAQHCENKGIAFFNRVGEKGQHGEIRFRVNGYDHKAWAQGWENLQTIQKQMHKYRIYTESTPDLQSNTIQLLCQNVYVKRGGK